MPRQVPIPPASTPFVDQRGYLTPSAIQFLQPVLTVIQGLGGVIGPDALFSGPTASRVAIDPTASLWTPTLVGTAGAGAQTYATQIGWQADIGPVRLALFQIVLSAKDGAMAGNLSIGGLPVPGAYRAPLSAGWISRWRATLSGGYTQIGVDITPGQPTLAVVQSGSGVASVPLPTSGIGGSAEFTGGALFFR